METEDYEDEADAFEESKYLNGTDAHMRLDSSLVTYEGKYYWAKQSEVGSGLLFNLYRHDGEGNFRIMKKGIHCNNPLLNAVAKDIGYVNPDYESDVFYISRAPIKKFKQGISAVNTLFIKPGSTQYNKLSNETLMQKDVFNTLDGIFPTFEQIVSTGLKSRAFSYDFCVHKECVFFKNTGVGKIKDGMVDLYPLQNDSVLTYRLSSLGVGVY